MIINRCPLSPSSDGLGPPLFDERCIFFMSEQTVPVSAIDAIVWKKEVELRGLPLPLQFEFEKRGAFWATRGLRMTDGLFRQLETEHPELTFVKREWIEPKKKDDKAE
jgi:hypothetical protein